MTNQPANNDAIHSYTAANQWPVKLLKNTRVINNMLSGYIPPVHAQVMPTNRCNLKCAFCSCKKRNKDLELSTLELIDLLDALVTLGGRAITITGGGEPLMHAGLADVIQHAFALGLEIGLVTNGTLMSSLSPAAIDCLTWCRVSASDEGNRLKCIQDAVKEHGGVEWALSYVLTSKYDLDNIEAHIDFANLHNFTHVRLVSDLINLKQVPLMDTIKRALQERNVYDKLVIYQGRKEFQRGMQDCRISLLKPVIGPDGLIYPCCGVQYAQSTQALDLPNSMAMGHIDDIVEIYTEHRIFDGSGCKRCYYAEYNALMDLIMTPVTHRRFV